MFVVNWDKNEKKSLTKSFKLCIEETWCTSKIFKFGSYRQATHELSAKTGIFVLMYFQCYFVWPVSWSQFTHKLSPYHSHHNQHQFHRSIVVTFLPNASRDKYKWKLRVKELLKIILYATVAYEPLLFVQAQNCRLFMDTHIIRIRAHVFDHSML